MAQRNYAHCLIDLFLYRPILNMLYITQVIQLIAASCGLLINDLLLNSDNKKENEEKIKKKYNCV